MMLNPEEDYQVVLTESFIEWVKSNRKSSIVDLQTFLETPSEDRARFVNAIHNGLTLLLRAVAQNNKESVEFLLSLKADPNLCDQALKTTALHQSPKKDPNIAQLLIDAGADLGAKDRNGNTALHIAAKQMDIELVALLLQNKANPNAQNTLGQTALHLIAPLDNHLALANLLETSGADRNIPDHEGRLPILDRPAGITTAMDGTAVPAEPPAPEATPSLFWRMLGY